MDRPLPDLDPASTALVLVDLQRGIVAAPTLPRPGSAVLASSLLLARAAKARGALVVLVHVSFAPDFADAVRKDVEQQSPLRTSPGWDEIVEELAPLGDVVIRKRQWNAFYGTDLDLQLRRRGRQTLVLGGISTNFGVESTARAAFERNYQLVFVEDAMAGSVEGDHEFAHRRIFPRLGRIASTADVLAAWGEGA